MSSRVEPLQIRSEIGRLREAIVHRPGSELRRVTPANFGRMLMDDTLCLADARRDHDELVAVLEKAGVEVHTFGELLVQALGHVDGPRRCTLVDRVCELEGCSDATRRLLRELADGRRPDDMRELARICIEGRMRSDSLASLLRHDLYELPPLPNLTFVRDIAAVVGGNVLLGNMAHGVRARESLLFRWIAHNHPRFRAAERFWLDDEDDQRGAYPTAPRDLGAYLLKLEGGRFTLRGAKSLMVGGAEYTGSHSEITTDEVNLDVADVRLSFGRRPVLEAGSVLVLSPAALLVGVNDRASAAAIEQLAHEMCAHERSVETILVAAFSSRHNRHYAQHLDTGFAVLNQTGEYVECLIYGPMFESSGACVTVFRMDVGGESPKLSARGDFRSALAEVFGLTADAVRLISCGGECATDGRDEVARRIRAEREWYSQAVNVLALAPGKLIAFRRNRATIATLASRHQYEIIPATIGACRCESGTPAGFLEWDEDEVDAWFADPTRKSVIVVADGELSRAHGGPRSLVLPLRRDDVPSE